MPTVIDSLIVSLTLDATSFTEGQRRAIDALRSFENQAGRSVRTSQESVGASAAQFFRMIESPVTSLRRQFEVWSVTAQRPQRALRDIGDASRQTGEEVERGANRGRNALVAFGIAGLGAFAAYEALNKVVGAVNRSAGGVFGASIGALGAGMNIQEFSAFAQTLRVLGNVPQEETQGILTRLGQARAQYAMNPGALNEMQRQLSIAGAGNLPIFAPPSAHYAEDIFLQLSRDLRAMAPDQQQLTIQRLSAIFPLDFLNALAQGRLPDEIARQRQRAPTGEQAEQVARLFKAENDLATAFESMSRQLLLHLIPSMEEVSNFIRKLFGLPAPEGGEITSPARPSHPWWWSLAHPIQNFKELWNTGSKPAAAPSGVGPVPGIGADPAIFTPGSGETAQETAALNLIAMRETGGRNVMNAQGSGAGGPWQFIHGTWRRIAPSLGIDPSQNPEIIRMPIATQRAAALSLLRRGGGADWDVAHGGPLPVGWYSQSSSQSSRYLVPPGTKFNSRGEPYIDTPAEDVAKVNASMAAIRSATQAGKPWWTVDTVRRIQAENAASMITNNSGRNLSVGNITVNAPLREGTAIADAIHRSLQEASIAANSNTGLQ